MMKNPRNLLIFAVLGGIVGTALGLSVGCMITPKTPESVKLDAPSELRSVLMRQQRAWNAGDIDGFMEGYLQNEDLRFASGGDITTGWAPTLSRYKTRYADKAAMGELRFDIKDVTVIDEDDGLVFGQWMLIRDRDTPSGLFTLHMKKLDGDWVIISDHTSSAD